MAANSSLSQLDSATLFSFFAQHLRAPPPRVTTPARRPPRSLVRSPVSIHVTQEFFRSVIVKRETLPSNQCLPQVSSNSLRRLHVSNAKRRGSTCKTRRCILQIQPVVRKMRFSSSSSGLDSSYRHRVTLSPVAGDETSFDSQSQLVNNLPPMPQICRKDQLILTQRTIENLEFLLITRLEPDHLIASLPSFLECRTHFRYILTRTSDKNVTAIRRPRDGTQLVVEAAARHSANSEVAADEPFPQLISPRRCSWAGSVRSFPTCVVWNSAGS